MENVHAYLVFPRAGKSMGRARPEALADLLEAADRAWLYESKRATQGGIAPVNNVTESMVSAK